MTSEYNFISPEQIFDNEEINACIKQGNSNLGAMGYTEHGLPHAKKCSNFARMILEELNFDKRSAELAAIAGYMHDIGNSVNRTDHAHSGAILAYSILLRLNMLPEEAALVVSAIGHHDEKTAFPVNPIAAALIIADKTDVRRSRVRDASESNLTADIHDRVNFAVEKSRFNIDKNRKAMTFSLEIDTSICPVMEYFEIFTDRMILCRKSAESLGYRFELLINDARLL